jgi:hypothetical protein
MTAAAAETASLPDRRHRVVLSRLPAWLARLVFSAFSTVM